MATPDGNSYPAAPFRTWQATRFPLRELTVTTMQTNLGKRLRSARECAGLTVDDAVYIGKIPRAVVAALEEPDFSFFSSPLYARSFLRQYGDYLGADVNLWMSDPLPEPGISGETVEAVIDMPKPLTTIRESNEPQRVRGTLAAVWLLLITGVLLWSGVRLYEGFEQSLSNGSTARESSELGDKPKALEPAQPEFQSESRASVVEANPVQDSLVSNMSGNIDQPLRAIVVSLPE